MGRHAPRRARRASLVSALAVALAAGSLTLFSGSGDTGARAATTTAADTTEVLLQDPNSETRRTDQLLAAGTTGFLHRQSEVAGLLWTDYDDGTTVTVEGPSGVYKPTTTSCYGITTRCASGVFGQGADTVALPHRTYGEPVALWSPGGGALRTVDLRQSADRVGTYGGTTVTIENDGVVDGQTLDGYVLHLVDLVDGVQRDRVVTGYPADGSWSWHTGRTGDEKGALLAYPDRDADGQFTTYSVGYLDFAEARFTRVFSGLSRETVPELVLSEDRVGWYTEAGGLHVKPRADLAAAETVPVASTASDTQPARVPALVGDWAVFANSPGVTAVSLTDGARKTLLTVASGIPVATPGGDALVVGGTTAADWWVQRVGLASDGTPRLTKLLRIPPYENAKTGIALSRGSLRVAEEDPKSTMDTTSVRTLTTDGSGVLTASAATEGDRIMPVCPYAGTECSALWGNSGTRPQDVYLHTFDDTDEGGSGIGNADQLVAMHDGSSDYTMSFATTGGAIVDVSDDYAVYESGGASPTQYVGDLVYRDVILKRTVRAAALNGTTLWSATTTPGRLTSYSLTERRTLGTVDVPDLGCVPSELQAAGRWVYWSCGGSSAGVYDTKAAVSRAVPPGDVLLGDGFTVRHDHGTDELVLTDATTGATRVVASRLPDSGLAVDRRYRWTVDEYTGLVGWFDAFEQTHIATTGVTASAVTAFTSEATSLLDPGPSTAWTGEWRLSRPVTSWSLTLTSKQSGATGRATRTVTGGAVPARVSANWNGKTSAQVPFPNGEFAWTLKATGLGTTAPVTVTSGSGFLLHGSAVHRDFDSPDGPDGRGDLLTLNGAGGLTFHSGTGTGRFGDKSTGSGWPTTIRAIPFGDLNGDRCNDVLVRYGSGALRLYKPGCGTAVKPSTSYTTLSSSGWQQYDVLTSPGDVTGDGRPDLIARGTSTGTVYLYKGTSAGKLSARVKLYDNWKTYKKIVGVGDLNGDGIGDLLAQDKANDLYRYYGKGNGTFGARTKLFTAWGSSYNVVVGVGDITDDGRADLVSRDSTGTLWRNSGDGRGSFGGRVKIATGFQGYKSVS